jgi:hypothetical protein
MHHIVDKKSLISFKVMRQIHYSYFKLMWMRLWQYHRVLSYSIDCQVQRTEGNIENSVLKVGTIKHIQTILTQHINYIMKKWWHFFVNFKLY